MDFLELWELTYVVLIVALWVFILRRPPMPSEEEATFQQLAKVIKSLRQVFGAAMMLALYGLCDVLLARGDVPAIVFAIIIVIISLWIGGRQLWRVRQCVRLQRKLVPVEGDSPLPEREVGK